MKKSLLKFPSPIYLIAFRRYSKATCWEINLTELTILCDCSEKEMMTACKDFRAVALNEDIDVKSLEGTKETSSILAPPLEVPGRRIVQPTL